MLKIVMMIFGVVLLLVGALLRAPRQSYVTMDPVVIAVRR